MSAAMRLFWFHHAGGHGGSYRSWRGLFPADWDCVYLEYPGRGGLAHLAPARRMAQLADWLFDQARPLLDRPYALFGHSMGSLTALEFARRAQERLELAPAWIGVSGRHAPQLASAQRYQLHQLSDGALASTLAMLGSDPLAFVRDARERQAALALLRADFEACETYRAELAPRLDCPLSAFLGSADPMARAERMRPWAQLATGTFRLREFDGGHFYLTRARHALADAIIADVRHSLRPAPSLL